MLKARDITPPIPYGTRMSFRGTSETLLIVKPPLRKNGDKEDWVKTYASGYCCVEFSHGSRLCVHTSSMTAI